MVLGTISDLSVALEWLRSTFLYVRVMKNPRHYGVASGLGRDKVEQKLQGKMDYALKAGGERVGGGWDGLIEICITIKRYNFLKKRKYLI